MFTIIGGDGKEYGPVSAEKIREWVAAGRANLETKARRDGEAEWKALGEFVEFTAAEPPPIAAGPAPISGPVDPASMANDLIARAAPLDVFGCLSRSFELWTKHFWPLVGVTLLVFLAQCVAQMIPFIGILSSLLLSGVFYGGLYYYYLGKARGQTREVGDAFAGFSRAFVPLMLGTLMINLIIFALLAIFIGPWLFSFIKTAVAQMPPQLPTGWTMSLFFAVMVIGLYLGVAWSFTFMLIIDRGLSPWTAMEVSRRVVSHQWFRVFFVMLLGGFLTMLGLVGLLIGILFTLPLMIGAMVYAYEGLCNPPAAGVPVVKTIDPQ